MKVEIELTDEQVESFRSGLGRYLERVIMDKVIAALPPKEKKWRFYKSYAPKRWLKDDGTCSSHGECNRSCVGECEVIHCFTPKQLEDAFNWASLAIQDRLALRLALNCHKLVYEFLSQQEVKG